MPTKINFSHYSGKGIKIAIIDSGIDSVHESKYNIIKKKDFTISQTDKNDSSCKDFIGHGTACAGIISRIAPDVEFYFLKIFDKELEANYDYLLCALEYAINQKVNIINLSLGTTKEYDLNKLFVLCNKAVENNIVIVAAENSTNIFSYPASFKTVLGVIGGKIHSKYSYIYQKNNRIELIARGDHQRVDWLNGKSNFIAGSSFAAPHISGIVALILHAFPNSKFKDVKQFLYLNSSYQCKETFQSLRKNVMNDDAVCSNSIKLNVDLRWIRNAILYPFNKEMHSLVRYRTMLPFNIISVYDDPGKLLIAKDCGEILGIPKVGIKIESINKINFSSNEFDTVIIGYLDKLSLIRKKNMLEEITLNAIKNNKNIYSLNQIHPNYQDNDLEIPKCTKIKIRYPHLDDLLYDKLLREESLLEMNLKTPHIAIFGTSPRQGKFTTQLALLDEMKMAGYKTGTIGTEHQSELFGFDFTFPMGYDNNVKLPIDKYITVIRNTLRILDERDYDLIITAGQSGIIPYELNTYSPIYTLTSIALLFGCNADAFILCINYDDEYEFIAETLYSLEFMGKVKTILIVFSDHAKEVKNKLGRTVISYRKLVPEEIKYKIRSLEDKFSIPVTEVVSKSGRHKLLNTVINYFS